MLQLARTVSDMSTMTQALSPAHATRYDIPASRPRLVSGRFAAALLSSFGALTSFYLLLSVTPMYAMSAGAGSAGAGLVTGSLMLTTVLAEFASPRLLGRFGYRAVFAAGALLLGGPAPALLLPHSMATIIAVSIARADTVFKLDATEESLMLASSNISSKRTMSRRRSPISCTR